MNEPGAFAVDLLRQTLTQPRAAAQRVMAIGAGFRMAELWLVLALLSVISTLVTQAGLTLFLGGDGRMPLVGPLASAGIELALLGGFVWAITLIGQRAGGRGDIGGALAIVIWLQVIALILQGVQVLLLPVSMGLADLVGLAGVAVFWALLSFFVAELHGFRSVFSVFLGIAATVLAAAFVLSFALILMGVRFSV